jgi:hypothetical protein
MTTLLALTLGQARALHLAAQGLLAPPRRRAGLDDVRAAVARMSLLQLDTIHVVARSPYLVLFSRLGDYPPAWLDELLGTRALFEVWAHEACSREPSFITTSRCVARGRTPRPGDG